MFSTKIIHLLADEKTHRAEAQKRLSALVAASLDDSKAFQKALTDAESATEYEADSNGVYRWFRVALLADVPVELRDAVEDYVSHNRGYSIDWNSECLHLCCGEDAIVVQTGTPYRRDDGVWQMSRRIIPASDYTNDDGEIDEEKRAFLIESHMEKTGVFPDIVTIDQHHNVFPVTDTQAKAKAYRNRLKAQEDDDQ